MEDLNFKSETKKAKINTSALGAAAVSLVETEIQLYTGFQPAKPSYDIGIDLRAISAGGKHVVNLQVKSSSRRSFGIQRRWSKIPHFLIVYVWNFRGRSDASVFVMSYAEAYGIIKTTAPTWLKSKSWRMRGGFTSNAPSELMRSAIEGFRATPERWNKALLTATI